MKTTEMKKCKQIYIGFVIVNGDYATSAYNKTFTF